MSFKEIFFMLKYKILIFQLIISVFCILLNCEPIAIRDLPESEKEEIMTKTYDVNYDIVFNAVISVLEKKDFIIKKIDKESGIIITDYKENIWKAWQEALVAMEARRMVNARVIKINQNQTKVKLNLIHENRRNNTSVWTKAIYRTDSIKEWDDYFQKIEMEIKKNSHLAETETSVNTEMNNRKVQEGSQTISDNLEDLELATNEERKKPIYLDIETIANDKYILVYQSDNIVLNVGEKFKLIRFKNNDFTTDDISEIGLAKVIKIKDNKVVLIFTLFDIDIKLKKMDKLKIDIN